MSESIIPGEIGTASDSPLIQGRNARLFPGEGALPLAGPLPDLTGGVFHGFPIRGMDLPAVTTSFLRR